MASQQMLDKLLEVAMLSSSFAGMKKEDVQQACQGFADRSDEDVQQAINNMGQAELQLRGVEKTGKAKVMSAAEKMKEIREQEMQEKVSEQAQAEALLKPMFAKKKQGWFRCLLNLFK